MKGGKLPYGKNVTLTGKLDDLKCGTVPVPNLVNVTIISASYLGQTTPAANGTISGENWSVPLGSLPADTSVNLSIRVTGKIAAAKQTSIVNQLMSSDAFQRRMQAFVVLATDQGPAVVTQEAEQLLKDISDQSGILTATLQNELPCVSITDIATTATTGLRANLVSFVDLNSRLKDVTNAAVGLQGVREGMLPGDLEQLIVAHKDTLRTTKPDLQSTADTALSKFKDSYEKVLSVFQMEVVAQLSAAVQMNVSTVSSDLAKYAGFDLGARYAPGWLRL